MQRGSTSFIRLVTYVQVAHAGIKQQLNSDSSWNSIESLQFGLLVGVSGVWPGTRWSATSSRVLSRLMQGKRFLLISPLLCVFSWLKRMKGDGVVRTLTAMRRSNLHGMSLIQLSPAPSVKTRLCFRSSLSLPPLAAPQPFQPHPPRLYVVTKP